MLAEVDGHGVAIAGEMADDDAGHVASVMQDARAGSSPLLRCEDGAAFIVDREDDAGAFMLVCDHAGRAVPAGLKLGVAADDMDRHIAWDIGAGALSLLLGERLEATVVRQPYSRLVIDCNRDPARADAMPEVSDGTRVPANIGLDAAARAARVAAVHAPYHARLAALLDARGAARRATVLGLIHSFTPAMRGVARPWTYGVLHTGQPLAIAALARLRAGGVGKVGDNEPYAMDAVDYTAGRHGTARGIDFVEIEVRQDLIADAPGQKQVAAMLAGLLAGALADTVPR